MEEKKNKTTSPEGAELAMLICGAPEQTETDAPAEPEKNPLEEENERLRKEIETLRLSAQADEKRFRAMAARFPESARLLSLITKSEGMDISLPGEEKEEKKNDKAEAGKNDDGTAMKEAAKTPTGFRKRVFGFVKELKGYRKATSIPEEKLDSAFALVLEIASDAAAGNFSIEMIETALRALNFDEAVKNAEKRGEAIGEERGELKGRNTAIEIKMLEELKKDKGDGVPRLPSMKITDPHSRSNTIFALANSAR